MSLSIACPACGYRLRVPESAAGRTTSCPKCRTRILIPDEIEVEAVPESYADRGERKKSPSCGGCLIVLAILGLGCWVLVSYIERHNRESLNEGTQLWEKGKRDEAVAKYKSGYPSAGTEKPAILRRIVDHSVAKGDLAEAKKWVTTGIDEKVDVTYESPQAQAMADEVRRDRAAKLAQKKAEEEKRAKAEKAAEAERARWGGPSEASQQAREFVKKGIAFPAEARFHLLPTHDPPEEKRADGSWTVWGGVTTKNAFGVKSKFHWKVTLIREENGAWRPLDIQMEEDAN